MNRLFTLLLLVFATAAFAQPADSTAQNAALKMDTLRTVLVKANRRAVDVQPDKTILNMDAQPAAIGDNVLDVLRRSPGVVIDAADNIQLNGKSGITILIDGKNTQLSGTDLAGLLKSVQAANINQIELIGNPSSKYDAAGGGGIINIKLKKSLTNGFNGSITGGYVQSKHARGNTTTNLNWRKNKTIFFLNSSWNKGLQHVTANTDRTSGYRSITQRSIEKDFFNGASIRTGIDFMPNKKSTFGVLWMLNNRNTYMDNGSTTALKGALLTDTVFQTRSTAPFKTNRNAFNLNYNYSTDALEYSLDADYTRYKSSINNIISNEVQNGSGDRLTNNATNNEQQVGIELFAAKGDLSKSLSSKTKLEAGFKLMATRTANELDVQNNLGTQWLKDTGKTNQFIYHEDIRALYASLQNKGAKFSWQAGLRAEQTTVRGRSTDLKKTTVNQPDTSYLNLFPTAFFQYQLAANHQLGLTANRRIDRPSYQDQNPFIYFLDALNREQGNAYLRSQFTNSVELSYTFKYATSLKIGYAKTTGYIEQLTYGEGSYTVQTPQNAGTKQMLSVALSTALRFTKWWSAYLSLTPYYHYYNTVLSGFGTNEIQNGGSWAFNGYMGNNFELGNGWKGSVSGWFNFQNRATIYVSKPLGSLDMGVQKNLWKDKATVKFSVTDIFNTQRWAQRATTENLQLNNERKWESQNLTLGFSWRFGNNKIKNARDRSGANEEGMNRIK